MAMNDDERIIEAVRNAWANWNATGGMADLVNRIRMYCVTFTIEPAPEPVYVLRIPEHRIIRYRNAVAHARIRPGTENEETHENMLSALWGELDRATPDPEPGA